MQVFQNNFPFFEHEFGPGIVISSCAALKGGGETWTDPAPSFQMPLFWDANGVIDVTVSHEGGNNVFRFTKDSVTRVSRVGALLDLCWWDIVPLAEGEEHKPHLWPSGSKVVGTPWILKDPYAITDVGFEADWVFEDKTLAIVEEQWQEHHATRFKTENQGDPVIQFRPQGLQIRTEEKARKCFGLFQGEPGIIRFWKDLNSFITWGTLKFRRHLIEWRGEESSRAGAVDLHFNVKPADVVVAGEFVYSAAGGAFRQQVSDPIGAMTGGLSVSQYMRALAEMERKTLKANRWQDPIPFPKPRTSKRGIFGKR